jgi:eukaryotic-like serine/threonine-protein kinase
VSQGEDEREDPPHPGSDARESFDPLLLEAAEALDPSPHLNEPTTFASQAMPPRLAEGVLVAGRYRLERMLGEGGMGEVWAATHTITRRRVAVKFLKGLAVRGSAMHQRFLREARAVSLVRHPGVVEVLDVFELEGGVPVMVMDLLVGETLGAKLQRDKALPVDQAVALVLAAVEAVEAAHARGIVHRDLKPDNIFLEAGEGGRVVVKVLDFGIAKLTATDGDAAETGALTETGSVLGTPLYMAPEQLYGEGNIDLRADVWSLGVILYECLSGQRPLEGSNVRQLVTRMLREPIVAIEELVPDLASELARLVGRMLAREPEDRPRDLAEVRQLLAGLGASSPPLTHSLPGLPRRSRSFGTFRAPTVFAAVAAVGILGWIVIRSNSHRTRELTTEVPAFLTAAVVATSSDVASVAPLPSAVRAPAPDVAAAPPKPPLKPLIDEEHATTEDHHRAVAPSRPAVAPSRPTASAGSLRATGIADASVATKDPPLAASASAQPAASTHKAGGLFEGVPF